MRLMITAALLCLFSLALAPHAIGDAHGADTGPLAETFRCTFNEGKDIDDLWAAADYFNKEADEIGSADLNAYFGAVLVPFRASMDGDYGWIGYWPSLKGMARGLKAYYGGKGEEADQRFADVAKCQSGLWLRTPILENYPEDDATPEADVVELYGCTLNAGATMTDVEAAEQTYAGPNADAPIATERWTPLYATTEVDLIYLVAHADLDAFTSFQAGWLTSTEGQASSAKFNEVMDCQAGVYTGRIIRSPAEE